jgi:flagellar motility protein MotE (MotC chaperone)
VTIALAALVSFKVIGLVRDGGYSFPFGPEGKDHPFANFGYLIAAWRPTNGAPPTADPIITGALGDEEKKAAEAKAANPLGPDAMPAGDEASMEGKPAPAGDASVDASQPGSVADGAPGMAESTKMAQPGDPAPATEAPRQPSSETERALILRLQERREALDAREKEMQLREGLLTAAEKRIEDRIDELRRMEDGETAPPVADASGKPMPPKAARRADAATTLKNLVTMYEGMRPKDAARVFETLEKPVLVEVVRGMSPRKVSEIMASMKPEAAAKLTVALVESAAPKPKPAMMQPGGDLPAGELPRLPQGNPGTP